MGRARHAQIMAVVDGQERRIFGLGLRWGVNSRVTVVLPALRTALEHGLRACVLPHISDERRPSI